MHKVKCCKAMQRIFIVSFLFILFSGHSFAQKTEVSSVDSIVESRQLYAEMHLEGTVNYQAFEQAIIGYNQLNVKNKDILTLIDFTKPSTEKRLYVFHLKEKKLLYASFVSHGRNSGEKYATSFSNEIGSYKSSLGFFITENTYHGKNGYSLVLNGVEKDINDKAKERAIVIHGASYSNPSVIAASGRLGRSQGCPALPLTVAKPIINAIKGGSLLYVFANDLNYIDKSSVFSSHTPTVRNF